MALPKITITRTIPLYPNGVFFQWAVSSAESGLFVFDVFRSASPNGPWDVLSTGATNVYNYVDRWPLSNPNLQTQVINQLSLTRSIYYRVDVTPPSGSGNKVTAISDVEPGLSHSMRMRKRKMLRDEAFSYRKLNGTELVVLKRKRWGARCPVCYDAVSRSATRADCTTCFGTTFTGGYYDPIITMGRRTVLQKTTALAVEGKSNINVGQMWLLDAPYVEPDDILVALRDNRRFLINKINNTELQTVTVHQKVDMTELVRSSIEYRIPVDPTRVPKLF